MPLLPNYSTDPTHQHETDAALCTALFINFSSHLKVFPHLESPVRVNDGAEGEEAVPEGMIEDESDRNNADSHDRHDPLPRPVLRRQHPAFTIDPDTNIDELLYK